MQAAADEAPAPAPAPALAAAPLVPPALLVQQLAQLHAAPLFASLMPPGALPLLPLPPAADAWRLLFPGLVPPPHVLPPPLPVPQPEAEALLQACLAGALQHLVQMQGASEVARVLPPGTMAALAQQQLLLQQQQLLQPPPQPPRPPQPPPPPPPPPSLPPG